MPAGTGEGLPSREFAYTADVYSRNAPSSGASIRESDPVNSEPMYSLECRGCDGLGPPGLGSEVPPFPFATMILPLDGRTFTHVGYHPVGMNPRDRADPSRRTSITARKLLSAFAMYSVPPSFVRATPFGVLPSGSPGNSDAVIVSWTFPSSMAMTDTELLFAFATNNLLPSGDSTMSHGWSPTRTVQLMSPVFLSTKATAEPPQSETKTYG